MPHKHKKTPPTPDLQTQINNFRTRQEQLRRAGYTPVHVYTTAIDTPSHQKKIQSACTTCNTNANKAATIGIEILNARYRTPVPIPNCGDPELGYIRYGENNLLPIIIKKLAESQYSTASILDYIVNLLCGSGSELRYHYITINQNGDPVEKSCPYELAGPMLRQRVATLRTQLQQEQHPTPIIPSSAQAQAVHGSTAPRSATVPHGSAVGPLSYRTKKQPSLAAPSPNPTLPNPETVGSTQSLLDQAIQDLYTWEYSNAEWQHLKENSSDLDVLLRQWALDQSFFNLAHLRLTLEQGLPSKLTNGRWLTSRGTDTDGKHILDRPKIIGIDYISTDCCRMEEQSSDLSVHHTYYSERFRYEGTVKDQLRQIVAYPSLPPQSRYRRMNQILDEYGKVTPNKRPQIVMPIYIPSFDSPYYPVAPWWSIFSSMLFNLAASITSDAVAQRNNSGMFSYLIYLNMNWFEKYCADHHAETDEEKEDLKHEYIQVISDFLKDKTNNGRIAALESLTGENEKNIIKSIEIQEIPQMTSKGSLEDMELVGNAISFAFSVHNSLIGSFGKSQASSSGTQQRELTELKTLQLTPQQRLYTNAWDFILRWNNFDPHARMHIKHYTLTTLDNSKTGMTEAPL